MKIFFLTLFVALVSSVALAQPTVGKIKSTQQIDIQKIVRNRNLGKIVILPPNEKLLKVKEQLKGKVEPQKLNSLTLVSPINLTVKDSAIDDKAFLVFDFAETVSSYENYASFSPNSNEPKAKIFFNAPAAGWYAFDFYLDATSNDGTVPLKFIRFFSDIQERSVNNGLNQHQIFVTEFKTAGWALVALSHSKGIWKFKNVEISQLK